MMYIEFKGTVFDIHIWDRKGAMTQLTGDAILRYVSVLTHRLLLTLV